MRLNQYVAQATGMSRRAADTAIAEGRVELNGQKAEMGSQVTGDDTVRVGGAEVAPASFSYLVMNKPTGYICSRRQQGNTPTIYELLPQQSHHLKPVGRLDKDSSGLLLLTNDGDLAQLLTHPSRQKLKVYQVRLSRELSARDRQSIGSGVELEDGPSRMELDGSGREWTVRLREGRNRQIRRTFAALGYEVTRLHRTGFGKLQLSDLADGQTRIVTKDAIL